jgi:integrase
MLPKGVHTVRKTLKDGSRATYYYAWRGGPRLFAKPGSDDFNIEYGAALKSRQEIDGDILHSIISQYKQSPSFLSLAQTTKHYRSLYLDEIQTEFGDMDIDILNDVSVKQMFVEWRDKYADTPKGADMRIETLRVLVSFAHERGQVHHNHIKGIGSLYKNTRADIIWTEEEVEVMRGALTPAATRAMDLARLTGIRKGDLIKLTWDADKGDHFEWETSKTGKRVFVPILPELRELLDSWKHDKETVLLNSDGNSWKAPALQNAFRRGKLKTGINKRFHDFRGTFATMLVSLGVSDQRVADIMGWSKYKIEEIRRVYVDNSAIITDVLRQLSVNQSVNRKLNSEK